LPPASGISAAASSRSSTTRARSRPGGATSDAGLEGWADLIEGDAKEAVPAIDDVFDVVLLDAEKGDYEELFRLARTKLEAGAVVVADNVLSHEETLGAYSRARQADPTLESVTVPLDRGLELSVVLRSD
jgi:predicted O-methyltransferase YrrM